MRDWAKTCQGCGGKCCGAYPLPSELLGRFADRLQVPCGFMPLDDEYTMPLTTDGMCPFLSRHDGLCVVYRDRAPVCRAYGEIPELPCQKLHPEAALLSVHETVVRIGKRLGLDLTAMRVET